MKRRSFLNKGILSTIGLTALFPTLAKKQSKPKVPGKFMHMVFFWLKETTDVTEFKKSTENLMLGIDLVVSYHVGEPAGTPREVVDNSYTVCLVATFDSKRDQDAYQVDPIHLKYVEENSDKWHKVQIYDSWAG